MFILRRISGNGVQMNSSVGKSYTYIGRAENYELFKEEFKAYFDKNHYADLDEKSNKDTTECYAFICNPPFYQALWKGQKNFIMTESGKTFANVSYK